MPLAMPKSQMLLSPRYTFVVLLFGLLFVPNSSRHCLAGMIDHTLLKQFATFDDLKAHFQAAKDFSFKIQP